MDINGILWEIRYRIKSWGPWWRFRKFIFVARTWRQHHDIIAAIYNPWFDIVEGDDLLYCSNSENWRCKFCGAPYAPQSDDWTRHFTEYEKGHLVGCLWVDKISPLRNEARFS